MNLIQLKYQLLISLLEKDGKEDKLATEFLAQKNQELSFSSCQDEHKMTRDDILFTYQRRQVLEQKLRPDNPWVIGYDKLTTSLQTTTQKFVNVNCLSTHQATFIVFTDYNYDEFIGILKSASTLGDKREKMGNSEYNDESTFINGKLRCESK